MSLVISRGISSVIACPLISIRATALRMVATIVGNIYWYRLFELGSECMCCRLWEGIDALIYFCDHYAEFVTY